MKWPKIWPIALALVVAGAPVPAMAQHTMSHDIGSYLRVAQESTSVTDRSVHLDRPGVADCASTQIEGYELWRALQSGRWIDALALVLLLVVFILRRVGARVLPWLQTCGGGWFLNFVTATAAAVAAAMLSPGGLTAGTIVDALFLGLAAAGGYQVVKDAKRARDARAPNV